VYQRMLRAANKAHRRLTAHSLTTGAGRENMSRIFRGGKKRKRVLPSSAFFRVSAPGRDWLRTSGYFHSPWMMNPDQ
jgi:hypothetical protein